MCLLLHQSVHDAHDIKNLDLRYIMIWLQQAKGAKESEQLHPSWAAKKALSDRAGLMTKPQGTKVIFDVDD